MAQIEIGPDTFVLSGPEYRALLREVDQLRSEVKVWKERWESAMVLATSVKDFTRSLKGADDADQSRWLHPHILKPCPPAPLTEYHPSGLANDCEQDEGA